MQVPMQRALWRAAARASGWVEALHPSACFAGAALWHRPCIEGQAMLDISQLTAAIQAYLAAHPLAADSADGVARWWLTTHGLQATPAEVEPVLAALVRRGRLRCVTLADGNRLYSGVAEAGVPPAQRM
jgi:hypothetical protein